MSRPARTRPLGLALAALSMVAGCREAPREGRRFAEAADSADFPPVASAGPRGSFVLERAGESCTLYRVEGGTRALGDAATCPRDLEDGERIRWAGRACLRESGEPRRAIPVRCPVELADAAERSGGS
ncbi:MAG: hypothetical protein FJ095_04575 [Deltaproteobacteria bacterium]|nr:hypothetical protein [Deltaproteobacteria bacterium]